MKNYSIIFVSFVVFTSLKAQNNVPVSCCNAYYEEHAIMDTFTVFIEGKIIDESTGKGIPGVEVELFNALNAFTVESNAEGNFVYYHISNGEYSMKVESKQHCDFIQEKLLFGAGGIYEMKICLSRSQ